MIMFSIALNKPINKCSTCCLVKLLKEKSGIKIESVKVNKLHRCVGISEINYIELSCVGLSSTVLKYRSTLLGWFYPSGGQSIKLTSSDVTVSWLLPLFGPSFSSLIVEACILCPRNALTPQLKITNREKSFICSFEGEYWCIYRVNIKAKVQPAHKYEVQVVIVPNPYNF